MRNEGIEGVHGGLGGPPHQPADWRNGRSWKFDCGPEERVPADLSDRGYRIAVSDHQAVVSSRRRDLSRFRRSDILLDAVALQIGRMSAEVSPVGEGGWRFPVVLEEVKQAVGAGWEEGDVHLRAPFPSGLSFATRIAMYDEKLRCSLAALAAASATRLFFIEKLIFTAGSAFSDRRSGSEILGMGHKVVKRSKAAREKIGIFYYHSISDRFPLKKVLAVGSSGGNSCPMRKPQNQYAVKKSVSLPGELFENAQARARQLGYGCFSDYIQLVVRKDLSPRRQSPVS